MSRSTNPAAEVNSSLGALVARIVGKTSRRGGVLRMAIALIVSFAIFAALVPNVFLGVINLQNIMIATPEIGVLALAIMLAMLTGGIDLSLVSVANLAAVTMSTMYTALGVSGDSMTIPIVLVGILVGLGCGLLNGVLISMVGITPILATLGTMQVLNGIAVVWTGGRTLYGSPTALTAFGVSAIGPVPALFLVFVLVACAAAVFVDKSSLGRKLELQGANPTAAKFSGIQSRSILLMSYVVGGGMAGLAGVLFISRNPTASADYGASYVLLVIVIAVLGGTNPNGGFASVAGVVLAALTLQVVSSGFTALRLSPYQYSIAQGVILIAVMIADFVASRRSMKVSSRQHSRTAEMAVTGTHQENKEGK